MALDVLRTKFENPHHILFRALLQKTQGSLPIRGRHGGVEPFLRPGAPSVPPCWVGSVATDILSLSCSIVYLKTDPFAYSIYCIYYITKTVSFAQVACRPGPGAGRANQTLWTFKQPSMRYFVFTGADRREIEFPNVSLTCPLPVPYLPLACLVRRGAAGKERGAGKGQVRDR